MNLPLSVPLRSRSNRLPAFAAVVAFSLLVLVATAPAHATPGDYLGAAVAGGGDLDGDGYDDWLVGAPGTLSAKGSVHVWYGGPSDGSPPDGGPYHIIFGSNDFSSAFGRAVAIVGDINGDGYDDIAVGQPVYSGAGVTNGGRVWVHLGSPKGIDPLAGVPLTGILPQGQFGAAVAGAGDVNGDGYDDLLVGAPYATGAGPGVPAASGMAYLFLGSAAGIVAANPVELRGTALRQYRGFAVAGAGDVDGDGFDDVAVGAPGAETDYVLGRVYLYRGSATGLQAVPFDSVAAGSRSGRFGFALAGLGDFDGDGHPDLCVGSPNDSSGIDPQAEAGRAFLVPGGPSGFGSERVLLAGDQAGAHLGSAVANGGDNDGDDLPDVIVGERDYDHLGAVDAGRVHRIRQRGAIVETIGVGEALWQLGLAVAGAGDTNGDGLDDVLIGVPGTPEGGGWVLRYGQGVLPPPDPDPLVDFALSPPQPNPSTGRDVTLRLVLPSPGEVTVLLHDARGRRIRTLAHGSRPAGESTLAWDGRDDAGREVPAGVYTVVARSAGQVATRRVVRF